MQQLEKQMKKICALCEERQALAEKDRQLFNGEPPYIISYYVVFPRMPIVEISCTTLLGPIHGLTSFL